MFGLLNGIYAGIGALIAFAVLSVYDGMIDDPMVRREALHGYVLQSERDVLAAQLATERQRAIAAAQTAEEARKRLAALSEANRANHEKAEKAIADDTSDDGVRVGPSDLEWLRRNRG